MFMSAPIAQFRGEIRAIRRWQKGELSKRALMKSLVIYHVLVPQIYQSLANGILTGDIDAEDQLRALLLGSLAGIPLIGDVITIAFREAQGKANQPKEMLKSTETLVEALVDVWNGFDAGLDGDFDEAMEHMIELGKDVATLKGLPVTQAERIVEGIEDIAEGDIKKGGLKVAGFPKSVTGK